MAVIKRKRTKSKLQALYDAQKMRKSLTGLILKDFGAKPKVRTVEFVAETYKMSEEDAEKYLEITDKYGITTVLDEFPYWFIDDLRESIMTCMREITQHITIANTIYPNSIYECDVRRQHQDIAIGQCEFLLQELRYVMSVVPLNVNKLMPYVDMIEKEIALLKAWRKSDNTTRNKIIKREMEKYAETPYVPYPYYQYYNNRRLNSYQQPIQIDPRAVNADAPKLVMCTLVIKKDKETALADTMVKKLPPYKSCSSH